MPTTRLILVRHGESVPMVTGVIGGPTGDTGLTDTGRHQAARLRERLARTPELHPDLIVASTLPRAVQTAQIASAPFPDATRGTDPDLCEQRPGEADGLTWDAYRATYGADAPGDAVDHPADPTKPFAPGGESAKAFDSRVRLTLYRLTAQHTGRTLLLFTHGGFVVAATRKLLGTTGLDDPRPAFRLDPGLASLTVWSTDDPDGGAWTLDRFNDTAHLG